MNEVGAKFPCRFQGDCARCGRTWMPKEEIGFVNDTLYCNRCIEEAQIENEWERWMQDA